MDLSEASVILPSQSSDQEKRRRSRVTQVAQAYRAAHEVVSAAMSLGLLVLGGFWLDKRYECGPLFVISGAVLGFIVAGASLRQLLKRLDQESARNKLKSSVGRGVTPSEK